MNKSDLKLAKYCLNYDGPGEPVAEADYLFDKYPMPNFQSIIDMIEDDKYVDNIDFNNFCEYYKPDSYDDAVEAFEYAYIGDEDAYFDYVSEAISDLTELAELYRDNLIENKMRDDYLSGYVTRLGNTYFLTH